MHKTLKGFIVIFSVLALSTCKDFQSYDKKQLGESAEQQMALNHIHYKKDDKTLHAVYAGEICNPAVIFVHGAPGYWTAWNRYLHDPDLQEKVFMISVDRLGYGLSKNKGAELSFKEQAAYIINAAKQKHKGPFLVVGHSYGGPVQLQMAADHQKDVEGLIVLAGAIDPSMHHPRWYHRLAYTWMGRSIMSESFNITTKEMIYLHQGLEGQKDILKNIKAQTLVVQGDNDWLVPKKNAEFAKESLVNAKVDVMPLPSEGHFLPWKRYDLVKENILKMLPEATCEISEEL